MLRASSRRRLNKVQRVYSTRSFKLKHSDKKSGYQGFFCIVIDFEVRYWRDKSGRDGHEPPSRLRTKKVIHIGLISYYLTPGHDKQLKSEIVFYINNLLRHGATLLSKIF